MVDINLQGERLCGPLLCSDDPNITLVQVGHCSNHLVWGMVVFKGTLNEVVLYTSIGVNLLDPTSELHALCFLQASSIMAGEEFDVLLSCSASRDTIHKYLLTGSIQVLVCCHESTSNVSSARTEVYILPTQDVEAMGLKLLRELGSDSEDAFPRRCKTPTFHFDGTNEVDQQVLNSLSRAGICEAHTIMNLINRARGRGCFVLLYILNLFSSDFSMWRRSHLHGIQSGWLNDLGMALYMYMWT